MDCPAWWQFHGMVPIKYDIEQTREVLSHLKMDFVTSAWLWQAIRQLAYDQSYTRGAYVSSTITTVTSSWAWWHLISLTSQLFTEPFVQARKHQSSTSLVFVRGIHQWLVNSPHKRPVMRKMFPFDDVIMFTLDEDGVQGALTSAWLGEFIHQLAHDQSILVVLMFPLIDHCPLWIVGTASA